MIPSHSYDFAIRHASESKSFMKQLSRRLADASKASTTYKAALDKLFSSFIPPIEDLLIHPNAEIIKYVLCKAQEVDGVGQMCRELSEKLAELHAGLKKLKKGLKIEQDKMKREIAKAQSDYRTPTQDNENTAPVASSTSDLEARISGVVANYKTSIANLNENERQHCLNYRQKFEKAAASFNSLGVRLGIMQSTQGPSGMLPGTKILSNSTRVQAAMMKWESQERRPSESQGPTIRRDKCS